MRVLKIIQANPEIFDTNQSKIQTEQEAIRVLASMRCRGSDIQKEGFQIRQTHNAIKNLISLGYLETAIDLAIGLIPKAQQAEQYGLAQDLCDTLIAFYYTVDDLESVQFYKKLYDKFGSNISFEHETLLLCNKAIYNHKKNPSSDLEEVDILLDTINKILPVDRIWYHYYYFQFKSMILTDVDLENLYQEAISYFKSLHYKHRYFTDLFTEGLISYYIKALDLKKVEEQLKNLTVGSFAWFRSNLGFVNALLDQEDIQSHEVCLEVMNHPHFIDLLTELKEEWKVAYKASVRLLLDR